MEKLGLPVLFVEANTCGEAWIKALDQVWRLGKLMPQHYGTTTEERMSKEATVLVHVKNPLASPRYHPADYITIMECVKKPKGQNYVDELLYGTLDHHVDEGNLSYTYHRRFWNWGKFVKNHEEELIKKDAIRMKLYKERIDPYSNADEPRIMEIIKEKLDNGKFDYYSVNQFINLINKAIEEPISRKLQMTTWMPHKDMHISNSPCLQRLWIRLIPKNRQEFNAMVLEAHFRSRDLLQAWGSNVYGLVELGKYIADEISNRLGMNIPLVQYVDFSNSLHIYQKSFAEVEKLFLTMKNKGMKIPE